MLTVMFLNFTPIDYVWTSLLLKQITMYNKILKIISTAQPYLMFINIDGQGCSEIKCIKLDMILITAIDMNIALLALFLQ